MDVIPVAEISVGIAVITLTLGIVWRVVDAAVRRLHELINQHTANEEATFTRVLNSSDQLNSHLMQLTVRVERLEAQRDTLPSRSDVHQVSLALANLAGEFKGLAGRLDGVDKVVGRLDEITKRQDDYLLSRSR